MFRRPNRIIVPQYQAPKGVSLLAAAELLGEGKRAIAAQVIDLAVRKALTITRQPGAGRKSGFTLVLANPHGLGPDELDVLSALFGPELVPGTWRDIKPGRNRGLGVELREPHRRAVARLIAQGGAREQDFLTKIFTWWRKQPMVPMPAAFPVIDHLWGIHDYVKLAEKDRFAMLQSPEGALRRTEPLTQLEAFVLNEKLLPYAVLFGLEKEWMKQLDLQYRELSPETLELVGDVAELALHAAIAVDAIADLAVLLDASDALDGLGAIFGGIGDALGAIDL